MYQILSALIVLLLTACTEVPVPESPPFCKAGEPTETCSYNVAGELVQLFSTDPKMPEETQIYLTIYTPDDLHITHAYLRGVNMYMGRIPLAFRQVNPNTWQAPLRLGVCAEPQMVWELNIEWQGSHLETLSVQFAAQPL